MLEVHESLNDIKIVMEYKSGGSLRDFMNKHNNSLSTDLVRDLGLQLFQGVSKIHNSEIIHRDLKLENILIDTNPSGKSSKLVIADFGFAIRNKKEVIKEQERCGTPGYAAPEMFKSRVYSEKIDIFSVGVILFKLATGFSIIRGIDS